MPDLRRRTRWSAAAVLVVVTVVLSGCSGSVGRNGIRSAEGTITGLTVAGEPGTPPTVRMAAPLRFSRSRTSVVVTGTGPPVLIDQLFVLQLTLYDARTGKRALSTYDPSMTPVVAKSSDDTLFPVLVKALVGQRQGSRVVLAATADDAYGSVGTAPPGVRPSDPVVVVADIVAVPPPTTLPEATGTAVKPPSGAPALLTDGTMPTGLDLAAGVPARFTVVPLLRGSGPVVREHSLVTVHYLGQVAGSSTPFDSTYFKEPALVPVGAEGSLPAWDKALVGLHRGSRVLITAPASLTRTTAVVRAPARETITWVVDVLGVS
ncbi:MAG: FKBP-type peptidyl-prolyl cis-trans isomerase [Marmoricola sp.]